MRDRLQEFGDHVYVALVTFTEQQNLAAYQSENALGFPILVDRDRAGYRSYGLGQGSKSRIYGWKSVRLYLQIFRTTGFRRLERATEDTLQLGGDFVIGPDGVLCYGFWGEGPDDRPTVDELLRAVHP